MCRDRKRRVLTAPVRPISLRRSSPSLPLPQIVIGILLVAVICGLGVSHFTRNFVPGRLSPESMDWVQAARLTARTRRFSTNVVRPLLTAHLSVNGDGTAPDFGHAPLYPAAAAAAMRAAGKTGQGQGDREAALVSLALFGLGAAACAGLTSRLFPSVQYGAGVVLLAVALYLLAGFGMTLALTPHPATLAAFLLTTLLGILWRLDAVTLSGEADRPVPFGSIILAGALYGLLYLAAYSALALLPALLLHLWRTAAPSNRSRRVVVPVVFVATALLVASPLLVRNARLAHNPFFHSRLIEIVMYTDTFPRDSLYRSSDLPKSVGAFVAEGGTTEIARKAATNLLGLISRLPAVIGVFLLPLFVLAALTRFTDNRVNRLRTLVYGCLGSHVLGLCFFFPAEDAAPLLLMYAPWAAAMGAAFLLLLVRARNWPVFYGRCAVWGWAVVACVPGIAQFVGDTPTRGTPIYDIWNYLDTASPEIAALRTATKANGGAAPSYLVADTPEEAAFRLAQPVVWLPMDSADMASVAQRTGHPLTGIILTPALYKVYGSDPTVGAWRITYNRVISLSRIAVGLDAPLRRTVVERTRLFYPPTIAEGMHGFIPAPRPEREGDDYSLLFWRPSTLGSVGRYSAPVGRPAADAAAR